MDAVDSSSAIIAIILRRTRKVGMSQVSISSTSGRLSANELNPAPDANALLLGISNSRLSRPERARFEGQVELAEAEGFEPSRGFKTPTRLAGGRHRPD